MLTTTARTTERNAAGQIIGWTWLTDQDRIAAYTPGPHLSAVYLDSFDTLAEAQSALLDHEEREERRLQVRAGLRIAESDRLDRKIESGTRKIARLMKQLPGVTDHTDKTLIEHELIRLNEEVKIQELMRWALREFPTAPTG
jgi:hypothetical protein